MRDMRKSILRLKKPSRCSGSTRSIMKIVDLVYLEGKVVAILFPNNKHVDYYSNMYKDTYKKPHHIRTVTYTNVNSLRGLHIDYLFITDFKDNEYECSRVLDDVLSIVQPSTMIIMETI